MTLAPGIRLGIYEIVGPLGAGGMGEVYRGRDTQLNRDVAIKILPEMFAADHERLVRFEREAQTLAALNHPYIAQIYGIAEVSPGSRALVMEFVDGEDLAQRIARGAIPVDDALPIARQIAEALEAAHARGIIHREFLQSADGTGEAQPLSKGTVADNPTSVTPDGKWLIFRRDAGNSLQTASDIMMAPLDGHDKPVPLLAGQANQLNGEVSPDGKWLAYESDESGTAEVYVRPFPQVQGGRWQVSTAGGIHPRWHPDGRELYYVGMDSSLFSASWNTTPSPSVGTPKPIPMPSIYEALAVRSFDISPDGRRVLVIEPVNGGPTETPSLTVVLNWAAEVEKGKGKRDKGK